MVIFSWTRTHQYGELVAMKLSDYLAQDGVSVSGLAEALGVTPQAIYRWADGTRQPRSKTLKALVAATGGKVQPNDLYQQAAA